MTQVHPLKLQASALEVGNWHEQHVQEHAAISRKLQQLPLTKATIAQVSGAFHVGTIGYEISAAGVIRQWGQLTVTTGTPVVYTFTTGGNGITFPTATDCLLGSLYTPSGGANTVYFTAGSTAGFTVNVAGAAGTNTVFWQALGH